MVNLHEKVIFQICIILDMTENERRCAHDALHVLHGHGSAHNALNRWFDKTQHVKSVRNTFQKPIFQLILTREGLCGMLIEHSVAEGIVIINMVEHALKETEEKLKQAAVSGTCVFLFTNATIDSMLGEARRRISPKPLTWVVSNSARELLQRCTTDMDRSCKNVDMNVLVFEDFGKEFIKKCKVSPDAFVQIVLQAAYFRCVMVKRKEYEKKLSGRITVYAPRTKALLFDVTKRAESTTFVPRIRRH